MLKRECSINRNTNETKIQLKINLDGDGKSNIKTGIGFFDHMLDLMAFHSGIDLEVIAHGDLDVCDHHTVEDVGIILGQAFKEALGEKVGIKRYGSFFIPMDETLSQVSLDISGRAFLVFQGEFKRDTVGTFATEMTEEFFRAFAFNSGITLHARILYGSNDHHKIEALFKALGRALREAKTVNENDMRLPSTKGML